MTYVAIDGDHIGSRLEKYLLENKENELSEFSHDLSSFLEDLASKLERKGYSVIYCGGDSVLAKSSNIDPTSISEAVQVPDITFSVGIGPSCHDAYVALKYAKASGRDCLVEYQNKTFSILIDDLS